jgi:hypothetical protein
MFDLAATTTSAGGGGENAPSTGKRYTTRNSITIASKPNIATQAGLKMGAKMKAEAQEPG